MRLDPTELIAYTLFSQMLEIRRLQSEGHFASDELVKASVVLRSIANSVKSMKKAGILNPEVFDAAIKKLELESGWNQNG